MNLVDDTLLDGLMTDMRAVAKREIMPRFHAIMSESARSKSAPDDLVTDADLCAEQALGEALVARLPGIALVGEEAVAEDASILSHLRDAELAALIDPVDGTWNFAHGIPVFGSMLALVANGMTIAGLIHYPVTGDFVLARVGKGAWHVANDGSRTRLSVAATRPIEQMAGFMALNMMPPAMQANLSPRLTRFQQVTNWRCSAFEYRLLATGAMHFCLTARLMPWDHAAGVLIHSEAGGHAALLDGTPYAPTIHSGHLLLAPDVQSWERLAINLGGEY
ncbi:inositol monophosphatase family protein [Paracoccus alkanivorans]|uniref:Inositol monophosphatase n=1 Tax=Paracoccus alkanivorans TaxID=2116655 RepID=A0A3M0MJG8_9RHOB|nr:inositol monophosphatase [Paracoccus alkanivorans]RMC37213.1 inositol monophosphatase [Paracoccus alkanivorans]